MMPPDLPRRRRLSCALAMCARTPIMSRSAANILSHSKSVNAAKQSQEAHNDQVNRDDIVKQSRYHEDQDTGDQRHERADCQMDIHWHPTAMPKRILFIAKPNWRRPRSWRAAPIPNRCRRAINLCSVNGRLASGSRPLKPRTEFLY